MSRVLALLVFGLSVVPALGSSPDPKNLVIPSEETSRARELIRKLGSEVYREREDAHAELAKMGRLARPALLEAAASAADPEVRFRCSRLLPKAGADDLKARLDTFLADAEGKYDHDLPGLKLFRKQVGLDKAARDLFVEVVKVPYNVEVLQALERSPAEAGKAISDRRTQLYSELQNQQRFGGRVPVQPKQIALPDIACLLFAETVTPTKDIPRNGAFSYVTGVTFLQQPMSNNALTGNGTPHSDAYKRIVATWMESREDVNDLSQLAYVAGQQLRGFPQSMPLLRKIINTDGVQGYAKGQALMFLTQSKGKEEIPFIKKLLANDTLVTTVWFGGANPNQPVQHQCFLRDVALAYLLTLTDQKLEDYGFKFPPGVVPNNQNLGYGNYAFPNEQARAAAMVKFGFWQLKYGPDGPPKKDKDGAPKADTPPVPPGAKK